MEMICIKICYYFDYIMSNEHFQYPQYVNTSTYPSASLSGPTPFRTEVPKTSFEPSGLPSSNNLIIQKIEALFPYLQDIMGKNDSRSNQIINQLVNLRDGLDQMYEEIEEQREALEN